MAKDIVFVVHGIGEYDEQWLSDKSGAVHALREAAKEYPFFQTTPLENHVEFVPIVYDDVFQRITRHWSDLAEDLKSSIPIMPGLADEVLSFVEELDEDDWEKVFAADAVLYWGFRLFQQRVSLRVIAQIVDKVAETIAAGNERPDYHILAHSLGTAVSQDALHHLGTETWLESLAARHAAETNAEVKAEQAALIEAVEQLRQNFGESNPFAPSLFSFESVTMISNVSGLIFSNDGPATSIVRPGTASEHSAYTKTYINANHVADPVSIVSNFEAPVDWDFASGYRDLDFEHFIPDDNIRGVTDVATRIHSAAHYIAHPNLHLRLLTMYVDPYRTTSDDAKAVRNFNRKFGPGQFTAGVKQGIDQLKSGDARGIDTALDALLKIRRLAGV